MRAAVYTKYGSPEVVKLMEVEKPVPRETEILVKVFASTVNRTDCGFRSAEYFISRLWSGLLHPRNKILGCEYAGQVEEIGSKVSLFKIGDRVFGYNDKKFGGHAEYVAVTETDAITKIPDKLSYEEAAPITEGAHYALCNIRASKIRKGHNALVYGATGAIGSAAVQLLKHMEVKVTAVCNTKNLELIKSLGVFEVIDYQTQDFTKTETGFDFIFDAVGKSSFKICKPLLNNSGIYISTELGKHAENIFLALVTPLVGSKKVLCPIPSFKKEDLGYMKKPVETGGFRPIIDRTYRLEEIVQAHEYVETGQKTGNIVITI